MTALSKLASELGDQLGWFFEVVIRGYIEKIDKEIEATSDEETKEILMEYRAYLREIGGLIGELTAKMSLDKGIDPKVSAKLHSILNQILRGRS